MVCRSKPNKHLLKAQVVIGAIKIKTQLIPNWHRAMIVPGPLRLRLHPGPFGIRLSPLSYIRISPSQPAREIHMSSPSSAAHTPSFFLHSRRKFATLNFMRLPAFRTDFRCFRKSANKAAKTWGSSSCSLSTRCFWFAGVTDSQEAPKVVETLFARGLVLVVGAGPA